jgi:hypothetical protein
MKLRNLHSLVTIAVAVCLPATAQTVTVFSNFGPGMTFNTTSGNWVGNTNYAGNQVVAQQFVPTSTVDFSAAILALSEWVPGVMHTAHVYLMTDAGGVPAAILEQIDVAVTNAVNTSTVTAVSALRPILSAGTPCWLVVTATRTAGQENAQLMWYANSIGELQDTPMSKVCQTFGGTCTPTGPWTPTNNIMRTAFRIDGTASATPKYNVSLLYDQTKAVRTGSTVPIKLQLYDSAGNNVSSPDLNLRATSITLATTATSGAVEDAGNANPDSDFRFDQALGTTGGYIFNLSTKGFSTGTYKVNFTVAGDTTAYAAPFQVK